MLAAFVKWEVGLGSEGLASASAVLSGQSSPIRCEVRNRNPEGLRFFLDVMVVSTLICDVLRLKGLGLNCAGFTFSLVCKPWLKVSGQQCQSKGIGHWLSRSLV